MPETFTIDEVTYFWDRWSDGETSRTRIVTLNTSITFIALYTSSSTTIGGTTVMIRLEHSSSWIATILLMISIVFISSFRLKTKRPLTYVAANLHHMVNKTHIEFSSSLFNIPQLVSIGPRVMGKVVPNSS